MVAELNRRYLERVDGFTLAGIAANSKEALALLQESPVDLVLLDIFMPGQDGLQLLTSLREKSQNVDVILVTAARDKQSIQAALRLGAVDYLIKPFEFERFQTALLGFRKRIQIIQKRDTISQQELDEGIFAKGSDFTDDAGLPKGLDRNTLLRVWTHIEQIRGEFTAEEIAKSVGISQVSTRKYLKFFLQTDLLRVEINYGAVGRPVYKYHRINLNEKPRV